MGNSYIQPVESLDYVEANVNRNQGAVCNLTKAQVDILEARNFVLTPIDGNYFSKFRHYHVYSDVNSLVSKVLNTVGHNQGARFKLTRNQEGIIKRNVAEIHFLPVGYNSTRSMFGTTNYYVYTNRMALCDELMSQVH